MRNWPDNVLNQINQGLFICTHFLVKSCQKSEQLNPDCKKRDHLEKGINWYQLGFISHDLLIKNWHEYHD